MIQTRQLCTFSLGDNLFGVDAQNVQEVIRYQEMTRVPKAPLISKNRRKLCVDQPVT